MMIEMIMTWSEIMIETTHMYFGKGPAGNIVNTANATTIEI